jgi:hypothetical protein
MEDLMKICRLVVLASIFAGTVLLNPTSAVGQTAATDEDSILTEILARYRAYEGGPEMQTWDMWKDYFLRSPNIGSMHGSNLEIGWESYRDASVAYYERPVVNRPAVRFEDLQVRVIDERTAWVRGIYVNAYGERELRPVFYDMLIKTSEGWRVFFSYVARPSGGLDTTRPL